MDRTSAASLGPAVAPLRCTVYARASSHEVVDQAYTSLDAQLDAGLACIASQAGMGWHATDTTYSDAEVSGAVLERPGLRRLMAAIAAGKIDVVVVYKLDRISRSALTRIAQVWPELFPGFQKQIVRRVLDRVTVHSDGITVRLLVEGFVELIREFVTGNTLPSTVRGIFDRAATNKPRKPRR